MACGLGEEELFILNVLYVNRNFTDKSSFNLRQISSAFRKKFNKDPEDIAKKLLNKGYLAAKRKKDIKYYITNMPMTAHVLSLHGYNVTPGRITSGRTHRL